MPSNYFFSTKHIPFLANAFPLLWKSLKFSNNVSSNSAFSVNVNIKSNIKLGKDCENRLWKSSNVSSNTAMRLYINVKKNSRL